LTPEQKYVVEHEGFVDGEYKDTKGISTSGVGQTGKYKDMTFKKAFKIHQDEAKRYVPKFDSLSENQQKALMSLIYRGDMKKNYKWVKHLNKGDYEKASVELLNHEEYKGLLKTNPKSGIIGRLEEASRFIKG
jgi:GH24 family phage-related lysozyme (muramidase)